MVAECVSCEELDFFNTVAINLTLEMIKVRKGKGGCDTKTRCSELCLVKE